MKYLTFFAVIVLLSCEASADQFHCLYRLQSTHYRCVVDFLLIDTNTNSSDRGFNVTGQHLRNFNSESVQAFSSNNFSFVLFPRNLQKTFPNLTDIEVDRASLWNITKDDLQPYGEKLTFLSLRFNKIKLIHADLFTHNPNLEAIDLFSNQIKVVEVNSFERLQHLKSLDFENNLCHSQEAFNNRIKVLTLLEKIKLKC